MGIFNFWKTENGGNEKPAQSNREIIRARNQEIGENMQANMMFDQLMNSGGGWSGSKFPDALKYEYPIVKDLQQLRIKSNNIRFTDPDGISIIEKLIENVVNTGLKIEAAPVSELLKTSGDLDEWRREAEASFRLYSKSKMVDIRGMKNFYEIQSLWFSARLLDGEVFIRYYYSQKKELLNPVRLQMIRAEQIVNPTVDEQYREAKGRGNKIFDGIEYDKHGAEVAYFVLDKETGKTERVSKYGFRSGRLMMNHSFRPIEIGQTRGIPILAGVIHEFKKITDYTIAEIQAAWLNAVVAGYVKPSDKAPASSPLSGVKVRKKTLTEVDENDNAPAAGRFDKPGLFIQNLKAGEEFHSHNTARPNVNFGDFKKSVKQSLSASLNIPIDVVDYAFNASYSASRAGIVFFWNTVIHWRADINADLNNPTYETWLQSEIESGRLKPAEFSTPKIKAAWSNANWVGIQRPNIDPLRDAKALAMEVKEGFKTRDAAAHETNGSDFDQNAERLEKENEKLVKANKPIMEAEAEAAGANNAD